MFSIKHMLPFVIVWALGVTLAIIFTQVYDHNDSDTSEKFVLNQTVCPPPSDVTVNTLTVTGDTETKDVTINDATFEGPVTVTSNENTTITADMEYKNGLEITGSLSVNDSDVIDSSDITTAIDNQALVTDSRFLSEIYFNPDLKTSCIGKNGLSIPDNVDTEVFSYTGQGILRNLFFSNIFAIDVDTSFRILVDGDIVWGNTSTNVNADGINQSPLTLERTFQPGFSTFFTYQTDFLGFDRGSTTFGFVYYLRIDVPFQSSIQIIVRTPTAITDFGVQPQLQIIPNSIISLFPYKSYVKSFQWTGTTYNIEYPLLNEQGNGNGVFLVGVKAFIDGVSGDWWESRLRVYKSDNGTGDTPINPATGFSDPDLNVPEVFAGATNGEVVYISSGLEDFFLSSYNWTGGAIAGALNGLLYNSAGGGGVGATSDVSVYRFMIDDVISVPGNSFLSVTFPSGDPKVGMSGSVNIVGQCFYYK